MVVRLFCSVLCGCLLLSACAPQQSASRKRRNTSEDRSAFSLQNDLLAKKNAKRLSLVARKNASTKRLSKSSKRIQSLGAFELVRLQEARLADIPVPLHAKPLPKFFADENNARGVILGYSCKLDSKEIAAFYQQEMDRLGWRRAASCDGIESLFYFEKPTRFCSVSLRPQRKNNTHIVIVTSDHQQAHMI